MLRGWLSLLSQEHRQNISQITSNLYQGNVYVVSLGTMKNDRKLKNLCLGCLITPGLNSEMADGSDDLINGANLTQLNVISATMMFCF